MRGEGGGLAMGKRQESRAVWGGGGGSGAGQGGYKKGEGGSNPASLLFSWCSEPRHPLGMTLGLIQIG